ncbi:MAG: MauE/DoxX family redox-associated membrane protein, partial [Acidimicrobiia bacterium]
ASGVAKLIDPAPTTGAMRAARLPASRLVSYALGTIEAGSALVAFVTGGPALVIASGLYLGFALFTFSAVRKRIPVQSCGCFGREDTPPNYIHVVYNISASISLIAVYALSRMPIDWSLPPAEVALYVSFAMIGVVASYLVMNRLPQVLALRQTV